MKDDNLKNVDLVMWGVFLITAGFSAKFWKGRLPHMDDAAQWFLAACIASILTAAYVFLYRAYRKTGDRSFMVGMAAISFTTIFGAVSVMYQGIEENRMMSDEYRQKAALVATLTETAERQRQINHVTKATENLALAADLSSSLSEGDAMGAEDQLFTVLGKVLPLDSKTIAFVVIAAIAGMLDLIFVQLQKIGLGFGGPKPNAQNGARPKPKKKPKTAKMGTKTGSGNGQAKMTSLEAANSAIQNKVTQRMEELLLFLEDHPDASDTEQADAIGVSSRETVRKYRKNLIEAGRLVEKKYSKN